ncbi:MAG: FtsX-like permease family protein [Candidatus Microsaccharimonas sp.]
MIRTGSIVLILSISIGLILAMLSARQAVSEKIEAVKSSVGNTISISPAGFRGMEGGGTALTSAQVTTISSVAHVASVTSSLSDRLETDDTTNLTSGIEAGALGARNESSNSNTSSSQNDTQNMQQAPPGGNPMTSITITGLSNTTTDSSFGGSTVTWTSGEVFDASADTNNAVIGTALAEKNNLAVGDTFTAYGETLTVVGIYDAGTTFANNGIFVSLTALQRLSDQPDSITSVTATVDSLDNLASTTSAIKESIGSDTIDVTNNQETADNAVAPLQSVQTISLYSLIGAIVAGVVIILLTMMMIVRERRREIGVMKAIGSSNFSITVQFIAEAVTLTLLALLIGTLIGIIASAPLADMLVSTSSTSTTQGPGMGGPGRGLSSGLQAVTAIQSSVGILTILYGVVATLVIAILGSAFPALMISKIKPAEAMRSE